MMNQYRLDRMIEKMKEKNIPQIIISDPIAIYYMIGRKYWGGERLLALYLNINGDHHLVINKLTPIKEDLGVDIRFYDDIEDSVAILAEYVEKGKPIGVDKTWPAMFLLRLQKLCPDCPFENAAIVIDKVRQIKDLQEQKLMIESSRLNDEVMKEVIPWAGRHITEQEYEIKTVEIYKNHGIDKVSFWPICAYGRNAADPHHVGDDTRAKKGDCVVLDIGGFYKDYASDMTRTVFVGEVSERQKEIYNIVLEANLRGIAAAKPGNRMKDVDLAARSYIEEMGYGEYFTHRTGHSIGLEDHEAGDANSINDEIIEVGQCFSVEPGIYLYDEGIGVRIEDLVLITEDGCKVLNNYPKDLIVVPEN